MIDSSALIGKVLASQYMLKQVIGKGASSVVFYAENMMTRLDDGTAMPVALKVLDKDSNEYKINSKSFATESRAVVGMPINAHTVSVQDIGYDAKLDLHFIVMEYVPGITLSRMMENHTFTAREIVSIGLQILSALKSAHSVGVVHRDVKPQNILVHEGGFSGLPGGNHMPFVKLADFGIALLPDEDLFSMTDRGVGSVHYISPEQAGGAHVDARSDLYSLGVVLYELAAGRVPFDAESATAVITQHQTAAPKHVRLFNPSIPLSLDTAINIAMQKDPNRRYKSAEAMEKRLLAVLKELDGHAVSHLDDEEKPAASVPKQKRERPIKPTKVKTPRRSIPIGVWIGSAVGALVIALGVVGVIFLKPDETIEIKVPRLVDTEYNASAVYPDGVTVVVDGYEFSDTVPEGYVIRQTHGAGMIVNGSLTLGVTVSKGPEMVDLVLPYEYRSDFATAVSYLSKYRLLDVVRYEIATYDPSRGAEGAVIGMKRLDGTEISLTDGKITKNMPTSVYLILNGEKKISFSIPEAYRADKDKAKKYIEITYPDITVSDEYELGGSVTDGILPTTVIGAKTADGTVIDIDGTSLVITTPIEIILIIKQ